MKRAADIAVAIPVLIGGIACGAIALLSAAPAMCLAIYRVEHAIHKGERRDAFQRFLEWDQLGDF